ncbi:MAG: phytanoyl-CoA dioxygenase family protein [Burkholderiaceae bacterium]
MLSDSQIEQYHRDGYVIPDITLSAETVGLIRQEHDRLLQTHPEFDQYCPALLDLAPGFLPFCGQSEVLDAVAQLIGPDIALWNSSFFAKPAGRGKRTPWHQDGEYWPIVPLATCTAWLAIDDSTTENGCLQVIKGSHRDRRLRAHNQLEAGSEVLTQELDAAEFDESDAVDIELKSGQFSLHDVYLLHGSQPNRSAHSRRGMTMRFMPTTSVFDRNLARQKSIQMNITDHSKRSVFLMRGQDRAGTEGLRTP